MSFSQAVGRHVAELWQPVLLTRRSAGEASGSLGRGLEAPGRTTCAASMALRSKVMFAMIYPAFLIIARLSVTTLFVRVSDTAADGAAGSRRQVAAGSAHHLKAQRGGEAVVVDCC